MGRRVYLGIRPEDLHEAGPEEQKILFDVEMKEVLGAEILFHGRINREEICVRLSPNVKAEPGDRFPVYADMDRIKLFDMDTEQNIIYV